MSCSPWASPSVDLVLPEPPAIIASKPNPYMDPAKFFQKAAKRLTPTQIASATRRLAKEPVTSALQQYQANIDQVLGHARRGSQAPRSATPNEQRASNGVAMTMLPQQHIERFYTQQIAMQRSRREVLERKFLVPLPKHGVESITKTQTDEFINRNYSRIREQPKSASAASRNGAGTRLPEKGDGTRRGRADHVEHFYLGPLDAIRQEREALLEQYMKPVAVSRTLSPANVQESVARLFSGAGRH